MGIISKIKNKATKARKATADFTEDKIHALREEAASTNEIFKSDSSIVRKTDTIAILVKKVGNFEGFQEALDKITKEGYAFMFKEEVRDLPIISKLNPFGELYYFQNTKFRAQD
ncbi:hypothetical protein [Candidatus Nitrosotenuis sp. DW1]|uniref:hypothetical protein n=1 Tax=Candidatus Nitrosotenuis sp. DW1 TaxID=2259672 RepID=UPI0015CC7C74|nr:hypothetical protein [Candidatus Nitrosotenuis sp. DW1]QLH09189.1 hypothetical protein DSQ19_06660 [Candidatus Nitrosotenuis sp. DW1]